MYVCCNGSRTRAFRACKPRFAVVTAIAWSAAVSFFLYGVRHTRATHRDACRAQALA